MRLARGQSKVNKAYTKATEVVAFADANLYAAKIKSAADVQAAVATGRAQVASAALGAATRAKVVPLLLVPGALGRNARAEVAGAANVLVASAVDAQGDKAAALADAAQTIGRAADKKAAAVAKADATLAKAVSRVSGKKGGRKVVELPGSGPTGHGLKVAPIVTPVASSHAAVSTGVNLFKLGGFGAARPAAGLFGGFGRRRLMQQRGPGAALAAVPQTPAALNGGAALAMFAQAAMAFGAQLQQAQQQAQQQQGQQQQGALRPEAGQPLPYNPSALGGLGAGAAPLGGGGGLGGGALSPRAQGLIAAASGGAGLAINAAAPLMRSFAEAVPVMVPALDGQCASGRKLRLEGQGTFCVLGNWAPAAQALLNGAGLATAAAPAAAAGVAGLIQSTRAGGQQQQTQQLQGRGGGRPPRGGGPAAARYLADGM